MKLNQKLIVTIEIVLLLLLGISHILSLSSVNVIISMIILFLFIISNLRTNVVLLFTAMPFFNLFTSNIGSTSLFYLYVIVFLLKYIFANKYHFNKQKILVFTLLILVRIPSGDFVYLTKWALLLSVLVFTYNEDFFMEQSNKIVRYLSISFVLSSLFGYYMLQNGLSIYTNSYIYISSELTVTRFAGLVGDSVFYSQFAALLIAANLVINYYNNSDRLFRYIIVAILTCFIILTYSKTGLILALASIVIYLIALVYNNIKTRKKIISTLLIIVVAISSMIVGVNYVLEHTNNLIISNYINRFSASDLLTGRKEVYDHYINLLEHNWGTPFFSMPQDEYLSIFTTNGINKLNRAHNIYLETVCAFGIFTSIILFGWIFIKVLQVLKSKKQKFCVLPMLIMLASGFTLHGHFEFHYYFILSIALLYLNKKNLGAITNNTNENDEIRKDINNEKTKFKKELYL